MSRRAGTPVSGDATGEDLGAADAMCLEFQYESRGGNLGVAA